MDAHQRTYLLEMDGAPLYAVAFEDGTCGTYALADEDVQDVQGFAGVRALTPIGRANIELDGRVLQRELAARQ